MSLKNIIFDMDGVLVDSEPMHWFRFRNFAKLHDVELTREESLQMVGRTLRKDLEFLSNKLGGKYSAEELEARYRDPANHPHFALPTYSEIIMPYVRYVLPRFKEMGLRLAIASSSSRDQIGRAIRECQLEKFFDLYVSGDEFRRSKPDPEIYLTTLDRMGAKAEETIVIEDSTYGIQAAKGAGLRVIAREDDRFDFDQSQADYRVGSLYEAYFLIKEGLDLF